MDVAMIIRPDAASRFGGDLVQAQKTAAALGRMGVNAWMSTDGDFRDAEVVHAFNLLTPSWTLSQVESARRRGKPVVLSPVYWRNLSQLAGALLATPRLIPSLARIASQPESRSERFGRNSTVLFAPGHRRLYRKIIERSQVLAPNSEAEAGVLKEDFPELQHRPEAFQVVPNGVDVGSFDRARAEHRGDLLPPLPDRFALCVARIDFRKNQLRLIEATRRLGLPLVLRGSPPPASVLHAAYMDACRRRGEQVTFLGPLGEEALWSLYRRCAVHCLPSFYETPGLSSLEAGLAGRPVVATPYGPTREYFGDDVEYCEPSSVRSIAAALSRASEKEPDPRLAARIRERYTWDRAAEATLLAYRRALEVSPS